MEEFAEGPQVVVQGYQFEPINANQTVESSSEDSIDEDDDQSALVPCNTDW